MAEEREMDDARKRYEFKKALERLELQQGDGTELITIYIPPDKQIYDVTNGLKDEFGQCANIKSKQTRTNVQSAISSILSRLRYYKRPPQHGLAVFCGTVNFTVIARISSARSEPPEPLNLYMYPLQLNFEARTAQTDARREDDLGLLVLDRGKPTGVFTGNRIEPIGGATSTVPGKQRKGGQSAARFGRLREIAINGVLYQSRGAVERHLPH